MRAWTIIERARATGLELEPVAGGLRVLGPKEARAALRSELAAAAAEIVALLAPLRQSPVETTSVACAVCARTDWVVSMVMDDGLRVCSRCWVGRRP